MIRLLRLGHLISRYTLLAALLAVLHNSILISTEWMGAHYVVSQFASAAVLTPTGYFAMSRFVYRTDRNWSAFSRYAASILTNFPFAIFSLWLLIDVLELPMLYAAPVSTVMLYVWNFLTTSWALGRSPKMGMMP